MLTFTESAFMRPIEIQVNRKLFDNGINRNDLPNSLHVFGVNNAREDRIYISRNLIMSVEIINFVLDMTDIEISIQDVGNPGRDHWIAFRRNFRQIQPTLCARIVTLFYLAQNNRLTW